MAVGFIYTAGKYCADEPFPGFLLRRWCCTRICRKSGYIGKVQHFVHWMVAFHLFQYLPEIRITKSIIHTEPYRTDSDVSKGSGSERQERGRRVWKKLEKARREPDWKTACRDGRAAGKGKLRTPGSRGSKAALTQYRTRRICRMARQGSQEPTKRGSRRKRGLEQLTDPDYGYKILRKLYKHVTDIPHPTQ